MYEAQKIFVFITKSSVSYCNSNILIMMKIFSWKWSKVIEKKKNKIIDTRNSKLQKNKNKLQSRKANLTKAIC